MIKWENLTDITICDMTGGYTYDPDFSDASIQGAYLITEERYLTEEELNDIQDRYAEAIQEYARERYFEE